MTALAVKAHSTLSTGEVGGQQHRVDEQPLREKMESPGEGHSAEESEEERRIAQGRDVLNCWFESGSIG